jgi:hypothetical protein
MDSEFMSIDTNTPIGTPSMTNMVCQLCACLSTVQLSPEDSHLEGQRAKRTCVLG